MRLRRQAVDNVVESGFSSGGRHEGGLRWLGLPISVTAAMWLAVAIVAAGALLPMAGCRRDGGPTANDSVQDVNAPGEFLGNEGNHVVHRMDCVATKNIEPLYRQTFTTVGDAMVKGYRPCKLCLPHVVGTPVAAPTPPPAGGAGGGKTE